MLPASPIRLNRARFRPMPRAALLGPLAVFASAFHLPRHVSHSTAVSHPPPPQWEENSSAPAHHSCRLPAAAPCCCQLFNEFRHQIASTAERYLAVDRMSSIGWIAAAAAFLARCASPLSSRLAHHDPFHFGQTKWDWRHAADRDANIFNLATPPRSRPNAAMHTFEIA